jgi:hypothetical protein
MNWITVSYQPVSLFSLKRSDATNMAGRSNLVPTPYAIKMALLRATIEREAANHHQEFQKWIEAKFRWIRDLQIYIQPPERLAVNRNGYKLRYYDQSTNKADRKAGKNRATVALQDGFVFREWVHFDGILRICCGPSDDLFQLEELFAQINYFGKRGCFFQYLPDRTERTSQPQFQPNPESGFTVQPMDDFGKKATFDRINPFSQTQAKENSDRVISSGLLPLRLVASTARYDFYERL